MPHEDSPSDTTWVLLPVYNESDRIVSLVGRWRALAKTQRLAYHILVVDDGSTDGTREKLEKLAQGAQDLTLLQNPGNKGLGTTLRRGLKWCAERAGADDIIVVMDGDNTHPPEIYPGMLECLRKPGCDVVIASRFRPGATIEGLSLTRRILGQGAGALFRWVRPIEGVRDYNCGYRAYRARTIREVIRRYGERFCSPSGFEASACLLLQTAGVGASFREVPLHLDYRPKRGQSHMPKARTIFRTVQLLLSLRSYELSTTSAGPVREARSS